MAVTFSDIICFAYLLVWITYARHFLEMAEFQTSRVILFQSALSW